MGIAVGSNPGNPFRAFADGSSWMGWDPADNNTFLPPGTGIYWPGVEPSVWPGGSNTWTARPTRQLDFRDLNGNGRYDYLQEPGELLVFAQDANGDGIPDRDWDGDGMADNNAQRDPAARVVLMGMEDSDGDGLADRFDPDGGGIPFYEDVRFEERRLFAFPKHPRNNSLGLGGERRHPALPAPYQAAGHSHSPGCRVAGAGYGLDRRRGLDMVAGQSRAESVPGSNAVHDPGAALPGRAP